MRGKEGGWDEGKGDEGEGGRVGVVVMSFRLRTGKSWVTNLIHEGSFAEHVFAFLFSQPCSLHCSMHTHTHTHTHTYSHMHTHICTHTHIHRFPTLTVGITTRSASSCLGERTQTLCRFGRKGERGFHGSMQPCGSSGTRGGSTAV